MRTVSPALLTLRPGRTAPRLAPRRGPLGALGGICADGLAAVDRTAELVERGTPLTPTRVHRLHRDLRRLRFELRLWRRGLPPGPASRARGLDSRLAELSRLLGTVRDTDVHLAMLLDVAPRVGPGTDAARLHAVRRRVEEEGDIRRELFRARLRAEREAGLFGELDRFLLSSHSPGRDPSTRQQRAELARSHRRLRRAIRRARRRLSPGRAHRLRIELRRTHHLHRFLAGASTDAPPPLRAGLVRLQRELGRLHDYDLLRGWVSEFVQAPRAHAWSRGLLDARRGLRERLRRELDDPTLRADRAIPEP